MSDRYTVSTATNMASVHDRETRIKVAIFLPVPDKPRGAQRYAELCAKYLNHLEQQHKAKEGDHERHQQV